MGTSADIEELLVSRAELARCLGRSGSRVTQLVEEKILPPPETHGKYRLAQCVRSFCRYQTDTGGERSKGAAEFSAARTEWMKSKARKAKLEEQAQSAEFVPIASVTETWSAIGTVMRTNYLRVPSRLASRFAEFKTAQGLFDAAMEEINVVLEALYTSDGHELDHLFADAPGDDKIENTES